MLSNLLFKDDIFISYSRRDVKRYADGLVDKLTEKKFSVFYDELGTRPSVNLPQDLKKRIRDCTMLVLVGTREAAASPYVKEEIEEFLKTGRTIVPIGFDGADLQNCLSSIKGVAIEYEPNVNALETGDPSANVISRIEKSFNYLRRNQRMSRVFWATAAFFLMLVAASVVAGKIASTNIVEARANRQQAELARVEADRDREEARKAKTEAEQAKSEAEKAKSEAEQARADAEKAKSEANNAKREAETAKAVAEREQKIAGQAKREAERQREMAAEATRKAEEQQAIANQAKREAEQQREVAAEAARKAEEQQAIANHAKDEAAEQQRVAQEQMKYNEHLRYAGNISLAQQQYRTNNYELGLQFLTPYLLKQEMNGSQENEMRGFEWYYAWRLLTGELNELRVKEGEASVLQFSPDGRRLATATDKGAVELWDAASWQPQVLSVSPKAVNALAYSNDGQTLAVGFVDNAIELWNTVSKTKSDTLSGHAAPVTALAFSPDGRRLASASEDGTVKLWDTASLHSPPVTISDKADPGPMRAIAFSPDSKLLAIAVADKVMLWDTGTNTRKSSIEESATALAFSPDGTILAISQMTNVLLRDISAPQKELHTLQVHDTAGFEAVVTLDKSAVAFSPDGKILAAGNFTSLRLWDATKLREASEPKELGLLPWSGTTVALAFSPDSRILASNDREKVKLWDIAPQREFATLGKQEEDGVRPFFLSNGKVLTSVGSRGFQRDVVKQWDISAMREIDTSKEFAESFIYTSLSTDGDLLLTVSSAAEGKLTISLRDAASRQPLASFKIDAMLKEVTSFGSMNIASSPDGKTLAIISDEDARAVRLFDTASGRELPDLKTNIKDVQAVAFSLDGKFLVIQENTKRAEIRSVATGELVSSMKATDQYEQFDTVTILPDAHTAVALLIILPLPRIILWDITSQEAKPVVTIENGLYFWLSADSKTMAAAFADTTHEVRLWDIASRKQIAILKGHTATLTAVAFSPDGRTLATTSYDKTLKLWSATSHQLLLTMESENILTTVAFSPDSRTLVTVDAGGKIKLWPAANDSYVKLTQPPQ